MQSSRNEIISGKAILLFEDLQGFEHKLTPLCKIILSSLKDLSQSGLNHEDSINYTGICDFLRLQTGTHLELDSMAKQIYCPEILPIIEYWIDKTPFDKFGASLAMKYLLCILLAEEGAHIHESRENRKLLQGI